MATVSLPKLDYGKFSRQGEVMLAAGVVVILFVMLVPLPTFLLDIMLCVSISISLLVLITTMFMNSPLEFTIFPSLLLVTTLLRLALNVASTRLILLNGDQGVEAAGTVIRAFGEFVVGGSYVVGAVIFLILFILNKVVITAGTSRIAEVAARFTLDAMPGKQMAIEADLNAGLIGEEEANERRQALRKEADFYGAMDGACKFVSGDVNAGMFITIVNLVGGIIIGVVLKDMDWNTALTTYSLLTIGDGLVSTIPSIIVSTGTGLLVSRAASEAKMGEEFMAQLTLNSRALKLVSIVLLVFALVPGLPTIPFLVLSCAIFLASRFADDNNAAEGEDAKGGASGKSGKSGKRAYKGVGFYSVILLPIFYAKMRGTYMYVNQINLHPPLPTSISIARARNARRIEPATPRPPGRKFRIRQMESPFQKVPPQPQIPPALPGVRGMPPRSKNRATYPSTPLRRE